MAAKVNALEAALAGIASALEQKKRPWALVGGLAVSARAEPRTTRDIDVAVAVADDSEAEALAFELQTEGRYQIVGVVEQLRAKRLATLRMQPLAAEAAGALVDLLFASSGLEHEIVEDAEELEVLPGLVVPVARVPHLIATKVLARDDRARPNDYDDLRALVAVAGPKDLDRARELLELVESRGFQRKRRLTKAFEQLIADLKSE